MFFLEGPGTAADGGDAETEEPEADFCGDDVIPASWTNTTRDLQKLLISVTNFMHVQYKRIIPVGLYRVGFPIFPPISSAVCNISMSTTITTCLEEGYNNVKGNYTQQKYSK